MEAYVGFLLSSCFLWSLRPLGFSALNPCSNYFRSDVNNSDTILSDVTKGKRSSIATPGKRKKKKKTTTINIQKVQGTQSREGGMVGSRWSHSNVLPRHKATAKWPNS